MRIQNNISAMNSHRLLGNNNSQLSGNLEKLSSGYAINRAADNAAGLAISEKMRAQITGLEQAQNNASDGISLVQTAEGAMAEVHSMLNRMSELAVQSANGTYGTGERTKMQAEVASLNAEINRISDSTMFNGVALLGGQSANGHFSNLDATALTITGGATDASADTKVSLAGFATGTQVVINITGTTDADKENITTIKDTSKISGTTMGTGTSSSVVVTLNFELGKNAVLTQSHIDAAYQAALKDATNEQREELANAQITMNGKVQDKGKGSIAASFDKKAEATAGKPNDDVIKLHIGETSAGFNQLAVGVVDVATTALGLSDINIGVSQDDAIAAIDTIATAINQVATYRSSFGAIQNRLDYTINSLGTAQENLQAAESRIRDTDMAAEMMDYTKNNILVQSAQSMLAQANQVPQGVLQLLG
ncbi:MAG: flagellin [Bacillota bacterium]